MGWQDRDYNQPQYGAPASMHPLLKLFVGSVSIGTWFGIRVRVHASLFWFIGFQLALGGELGWKNALVSSAILFAIVLLHEFGHCIGARLVGGYAEDIMLWPLGGIAFTETARRPWERFVTVAAGPLVNVIICLITGIAMYFVAGALPPINPLLPFLGKYFQTDPSFLKVLFHPVGYYLWWVYAISLAILFFNLLPIYPMDGGKLAQIALWKFVGYYRSMVLACTVGIVGAVAIGIYGVTTQAWILIALAIFGGMDCYRQRQMLLAAGPDSFTDEEDYGYEQARRSQKRGKNRQSWFHSAAKKAKAERLEQEEIDRILAKVKEKGLHSLTWFEKRSLKRATERQRKRDMAERL